MNSKYYLCKSPVYSPNYLRLTSWKECFQKPIPFTPYLPSHLEMIPLTSSLNLEMGSSMLSNSNSSAESLSLYNNVANKMSHWESLLFVGSNSLVTLRPPIFISLSIRRTTLTMTICQFSTTHWLDSMAARAPEAHTRRGTT